MKRLRGAATRATANNTRAATWSTAGACEQGMERGQPVTKADVARNGLQTSEAK
jgi:hypothetical protein